MTKKEEALDWALTYLREVVGVEIEDNEEYQQAVKTLHKGE
jgi:predicted DNA-binding protein